MKRGAQVAKLPASVVTIASFVEYPVERPHRGAEVERAGVVRHLPPRLAQAAQLRRPAVPRMRRGRRLAGRSGDGEGVEVGNDAERRAIHPPDLCPVGMHLHDRHVPRWGEQRIALGHRVAEPGADRQDEVGVARLGEQRRIGADAEVAHEIVPRPIVQRLAAEADSDRQAARRGVFRDRLPPGRGPARAAQHQQRPTRLAEQRFHPRQRRRIGDRCGHRRARHVRDLHDVALHFLRQRDHHRAGAAGQRDVDRVRYHLGDAYGLVDLGGPFRQRGEHLPVVDFLERVAPGVGKRDLAYEQQQRRAVLHRHVHADRPVTGARAAGDEGRGGSAGQLAVGFRHVHRGPLEPAGDELQLLVVVVETVEHIEVALARHGEHVVDALCDQRVGQDFPAHAGREATLAGLRQIHAVPPGDKSAARRWARCRIRRTRQAEPTALSCRGTAGEGSCERSS